MPKLPPESLLHRLDLAIRSRIDATSYGDTMAFGVRGGVEMDRIRAWAPGDDWRQLDAAATARTGEPHVRILNAERRVTVWLAIDVSSSMAFGTQQWEKGDLAMSIATALGLVSLRQASKVGAMPLSDGDDDLIPPRAGRAALLSLVESLEPERDDLEGDLAAALTKLDRSVRRRSMVIIVSDFRDTKSNWAPPLARIAGRNETICIEVYDPREIELPDVGVARFVDPETGRAFTIDTTSSRLRERFAERADQMRTEIAHAISASGADHFRIGTDDNWLDSLMVHMQRRRRRR